MSGYPPPPAYTAASQKPAGEWRNGICNCGKSLKWCLIGCFVPGSLIYAIADRSNNMSRGSKVLFVMTVIYGLGYLSYANMGGAGMNYNKDPTNFHGILRIGGIVFVSAICVLWLVYIFQLSLLRSAVRRKYGIHGSECADLCTTCCCQLWCFGLQNCQMYYEVHEQEAIAIV